MGLMTYKKVILKSECSLTNSLSRNSPNCNFEGVGNLFKGRNVQIVNMNEFMRSGTMQGRTSDHARTYHCCHVNDPSGLKRVVKRA